MIKKGMGFCVFSFTWKIKVRSLGWESQTKNRNETWIWLKNSLENGNEVKCALGNWIYNPPPTLSGGA